MLQVLQILQVSCSTSRLYVIANANANKVVLIIEMIKLLIN